MRKISILLLFVCGLCSAQVTDEQLYHAYLSEDMSLWGDFLTNSSWETLDDTERLRIINYEYGYIPWRVDRGYEDGAQLLERFIRHIEEQKETMTPSLYATYRSAACAYEYMLDKSRLISSGYRAFKYAREAYERDTLNPIAVSLRGNIEYYTPKMFGGNKRKAFAYFTRAEQLMRQDSARYAHLWNYPALQLCIAQCYEREGEKEKAEAKYREILVEHPGFRYVENHRSSGSTPEKNDN